MNALETEHLIRKCFGIWKPDHVNVDIAELTPDCSLRRYYRVSYTGPEELMGRSVIAVIYDSTAPAESETSNPVPTDLAFVQLQELFAGNGVNVPQVYAQFPEQKIYLLEDLGDNLLASQLAAWFDSKGEDALLRSALLRSYGQAMQQIKRIQEGSFPDNFFAVNRRFSQASFTKEMSEYLDFAVNDQINPRELGVINKAMGSLSEALVKLPYVLSHRDFHSWNLIIDKDSRVRVIDFQDALLAPRTYDLISLLHDRDTDRMLGESVLKELLVLAKETFSLEDEFEKEYCLTSLQRDLKVVGRFCKLANLRGLKAYLRWVPGTQERIGRSLSYLTASANAPQGLEEMARILEEKNSDVARGLTRPMFS